MAKVLVTLDEAKRQLRVFSSHEDVDISDRMVAASDMVLNYITQADDSWTDQTAPPLIKMAILITLSALYADREGSGLPSNVKDMLERYRDPSLA